MRTYFYYWLAAALLLASTARAQTLTADWAVPCGNPLAYYAGVPAYYYGGAPSLTTDTQGNSYVLGAFMGTITLGTTTLSAIQTYSGNTGPADTYLAKLNAQGQYQWAVQFGDGQSVQGNQLAVDNLGNVYVSGSFDSYSMQAGVNGPTLYNSSNNYEGFVARFSSQTGQCQWARRFGGTGFDSGGALALNAVGEVYITGRIGTSATDFGPFTLPAGTSYNGCGFLAKLSAAGTWLWAQQLGSNGQVLMSGLVLDGQGNLYLSGSFASPGVTLGTATLVTHQLAGWGGAQGSDVVVAKYLETGGFVWAVQGDNSGGNNAKGGTLVYDGQGHLYTASYFNSQSLHLGSLTLANASSQMPQPIPLPPTPYTENYYSDAYVARLDAGTGAWQWAARRGGQYDDAAAGAIVSSGNRLLISYSSAGYSPGNYQTLAELAELNPSNGAWSASYSLPVSVKTATDQLGRVYFTGAFDTSSLSLGGQTVASITPNRATNFVARFGALVLASQPAVLGTTGLQAWPTPGPGTGVWVQGAQAGQAVEVLDMLGRRVGGGTMPASGPLRLSWAGAGLAPGVYVLRSGQLSSRWVVE